MEFTTSTIILLVILAIIALVVIKNFAKIRKFVAEVATELKKVTWSNRKELMDATWVVIVSSIFLGVFIGSTDFALSKLLGFIIR